MNYFYISIIESQKYIYIRKIKNTRKIERCTNVEKQNKAKQLCFFIRRNLFLIIIRTRDSINEKKTTKDFYKLKQFKIRTTIV